VTSPAWSPITHQAKRAAEDIGRLRRQLGRPDEDSYVGLLLDRIGNRVLDLAFSMLPTAADRCREGMSVDEALAETDRETARWLRLIGRNQGEGA